MQNFACYKLKILSSTCLLAVEGVRGLVATLIQTACSAHVDAEVAKPLYDDVCASYLVNSGCRHITVARGCIEIRL